MSFDTLSSAPTSKSQPADESRRGPPARKPGGSIGEGLRGFQFPLVQPRDPEAGFNRPVPPPLQRNHSAAPSVPMPADSPSRSLPLQLPPSRPMMMRQASVAVMEGRAQGQAQALAMAQAQAQAQVGDGPLSPAKQFAVPNALGRPGGNGGSGGVSMMRSKSQGRVDGDGAVGLRDLLKVKLAGSRSETALADDMCSFHRPHRRCRTSCHHHPRPLPRPRPTASSPHHRRSPHNRIQYRFQWPRASHRTRPTPHHPP
jgi:protein-serine/threonine kinase